MLLFANEKQHVPVFLPVFLAALLAAGCGSGQPSLPPLQPGDIVLAFGNSLTFGTGAAPAQSYPAVLARATGLEVVNAGIPGEVSAAGLRRLPAVLEATAPRLVVLCHGGNDALRRLDSAATERNLRAMIALIRGRGAGVVLLGVPAPGLFLSTAELYDRIAEELSVPYDGDIVGTILGDNRLKSDAIHPNAAGYARLAEAVAQALRKHGAL